jgi:tetratricopeptide (TPR) repeat protein
MIDHNKIEDAIDSYFKNTPTAKIIENLDRLSADREKYLDRKKINHQTINHQTIHYKTANNNDSIIGNLVRFEEVSPANQDVAFLNVSIESLVAPLGLPLYNGYDDLDEMRLTFLTLPSGKTVTLMEYLHSPQPGVCISVDAAMQNIPQIVFESCQQLQVSREEAIWFHPDWQDEIDRLYTEHGSIEKRPELSQSEELPQNNQYEPIDCFNHALRIYTREYVPATYWAMLQRNLGLAYFNRNQGDRRENLKRSIECFKKSLEIYTQNEFPEKWKINRDDLVQSLKSLQGRSTRVNAGELFRPEHSRSPRVKAGKSFQPEHGKSSRVNGGLFQPEHGKSSRVNGGLFQSEHDKLRQFQHDLRSLKEALILTVDPVSQLEIRRAIERITLELNKSKI